MSLKRTYLSLDVGEKRIGVALGDDAVRIAIPSGYIEVDGTEFDQIVRKVHDEGVSVVVVGYPRNQSGESTAQTEHVKAFVERIRDLVPEVVFQDESLTSVLAEQQLKNSGRPYVKGDIDSRAASIILQDYLEGIS